MASPHNNRYAILFVCVCLCVLCQCVLCVCVCVHVCSWRRQDHLLWNSLLIFLAFFPTVSQQRNSERTEFPMFLSGTQQSESKSGQKLSILCIYSLQEVFFFFTISPMHQHQAKSKKRKTVQLALISRSVKKTSAKPTVRRIFQQNKSQPDLLCARNVTRSRAVLSPQNAASQCERVTWDLVIWLDEVKFIWRNCAKLLNCKLCTTSLLRVMFEVGN